MKDKKQTAIETEEVEVVKKQSKASKVFSTIINVVLVLAIVLAAISTYVSFVTTSGNGVPSIFGFQMYSIQTESMYPILKPGDLIFNTAVEKPEDLQVGDIITYWTVINGERVLNTHKIHEIYDGGGYLIFETKGEANTVVDSLTVHESEVVGKYKFRVEGLGKVFDYLQDSTGFLVVVVIPVFIFFLFYLVQFFRVLFEYKNVKNRIKYEQERGKTEDLIAEQEKKAQDEKEAERAKMEEELREKLKAELLEEKKAQEAAAERAKMEEELREKLKAELMQSMGMAAAVTEPAEAAEEETAEETAEEVAEEAAEKTPAEETAEESAEETAEEESVENDSEEEETKDE